MVTWGEFFFLTLLAKSATCPEIHHQVGGFLTEMPSRFQFLKFLVGRVPGGKSRLSGKNLRIAWHGLPGDGMTISISRDQL